MSGLNHYQLKMKHRDITCSERGRGYDPAELQKLIKRAFAELYDCCVEDARP